MLNHGQPVKLTYDLYNYDSCQKTQLYSKVWTMFILLSETFCSSEVYDLIRKVHIADIGKLHVDNSKFDIIIKIKCIIALNRWKCNSQKVVGPLIWSFPYTCRSWSIGISYFTCNQLSLKQFKFPDTTLCNHFGWDACIIVYNNPSWQQLVSWGPLWRSSSVHCF